MSDGLARVFALQETKRKENEAARQKQIARTQREVAAFNASPVMQLFRELSNVLIKPGVSGVEPRPFSALIVFSSDDLFAGKCAELTLRMSSGAQARWSCFEDRDSGQMRYQHRKGDLVLCNDSTPDSAFIDTFVQFAADVLEPRAVASLVSAPAEEKPQPKRRILQVP